MTVNVHIDPAVFEEVTAMPKRLVGIGSRNLLPIGNRTLAEAMTTVTEPAAVLPKGDHVVFVIPWPTPGVN